MKYILIIIIQVVWLGSVNGQPLTSQLFSNALAPFFIPTSVVNMPFSSPSSPESRLSDQANYIFGSIFDSDNIYTIYLNLKSTHRSWLDGDEDGHKDRFCAEIDIPWTICRNTHEIDGVKFGGSRSLPLPVLEIFRINGPYQKEGSGGWEWNEAEYGKWTHRTESILTLKWSDVRMTPMPQVPFPFGGTALTPLSASVDVAWAEGDPGLGRIPVPIPVPIPITIDTRNDDYYYANLDFNEGVSMCPKLYRSDQWFLLSRDNTFFLCEEDGCDEGTLEIKFDLECKYSCSQGPCAELLHPILASITSHYY